MLNYIVYSKKDKRMINLVLIIYCAFILFALILYIPRIFGFIYGFKKSKTFVATSKRKIGIIIPARGESEIIGDLFKSIAEQDYDRTCFDMFVIVKDEDDPTVDIAKAAGASVTIVPDQHCKGDALDGFFMSQAKDKLENYDAFVIVDADGLLSPNYLSEINNALESGADIIETQKIAKNFLGDKNCRSLFSNCSALTYPIIDELGNAYRMQKGMPLTLIGQGLVLRRCVIEEIGGWPYRTMTEDYELKLDSLLRGYKSIYYPDAILYTEEAKSHRENYVRRVRWVTGHKQCDIKYKKQIKQQIKVNKRITLGEFEYFFGLLPYFVFLAGEVIAFLAGIGLAIYYFASGSVLWMSALKILVALPPIILYLVLYSYSVLALLTSKHAFSSLTKGEFLAVAFFNPFYLIEYVPIYFSCARKIRKNEVIEWKATERVMISGDKDETLSTGKE